MPRTSALLFAIVLASTGSAMAAPVTRFVPDSVSRAINTVDRPDESRVILVQRGGRGGGGGRAAGGRGGGGANRSGNFNSNNFHRDVANNSSRRTNVNASNRNATVNRSANVNASRNVNVYGGGGGGCCYGGNYSSGPSWGGVAAGVAVGAMVGAAANSAYIGASADISARLRHAATILDGQPVWRLVHENTGRIHQDDADRRGPHRPADLCLHPPPAEGTQRPSGCGQADHRRHSCGCRIQQLLAILVLVAICFIMGLIVRTGPGLRAKNAFEEAVLSKLPGYTLLRGLAGRIAGRADEPTFTPALVEIEEALVPALIIEELEDGSYTVLVPSVPTPMAGALYILPRERVHPVDVSFTTALKVFTKWGTGAGEFVRAMRPASACHEATCRRINHQTIRHRRLFSLDQAI